MARMLRVVVADDSGSVWEWLSHALADRNAHVVSVSSSGDLERLLDAGDHYHAVVASPGLGSRRAVLECCGTQAEGLWLAAPEADSVFEVQRRASGEALFRRRSASDALRAILSRARTSKRYSP